MRSGLFRVIRFVKFIRSSCQILLKSPFAKQENDRNSQQKPIVPARTSPQDGGGWVSVGLSTTSTRFINFSTEFLPNLEDRETTFPGLYELTLQPRVNLRLEASHSVSLVRLWGPTTWSSNLIVTICQTECTLPKIDGGVYDHHKHVHNRLKKSDKRIMWLTNQKKQRHFVWSVKSWNGLKNWHSRDTFLDSWFKIFFLGGGLCVNSSSPLVRRLRRSTASAIGNEKESRIST